MSSSGLRARKPGTASPGGGGGGRGSAVSNDINETSASHQSLMEENLRLRLLISSNQIANACAKMGPLFFYDEKSSSLFASPWTRRFYVLQTDGRLVAYATPAAAAMATANGATSTSSEVTSSPANTQGAPCVALATTNVVGLAVQREGVKVGRYFAFRLVEPTTGAVVLRLSSESMHEESEWVAALHTASRGFPTRERATSDANQLTPGETPPYSRDVSPSLSTDSAAVVAWRRSHGTAAAAAAAATTPTPTTQNGQTATNGSKAAATANKRPPMQACTPVHKRVASSILSSEQISLHRHSGIINLAMVIIVVTHFRLVVENLKKYGMLFSLRFWLGTTGGARSEEHLPLLVCYLCHPLFSIAALTLENLLARTKSRALDVALRIVYSAVLFAVVAIPCRVINVTRSEPLPGFGLLAVSLVLWMKLYSYSEANAHLRAMYRANKALPASDRLPDDVAYPRNLTFGNLFYFVAAPTLCYQVSYPRTQRVRKRWLFRRVVEWLFYQALTLFIVEQYMIPTVANALKDGAFDRLDVFFMLERVLKLALPNLYVWLCIFYALFHLWLNILAEVTRFGDRDFYKDWWNASDLEEYWRTWNMPVHRWMLRHIYHPAVRQGLPKAAAMILVFFVSAVGHELLIGVPCHILTCWAFWGIMGQVPLILLTKWLRKRLRNEQLGNILFWVSFCIFGQPASIILYMRAYQKTYGV